MSGKNHKLFIFEFDGGSWNVIEPLLSQGKLPNLKRLMIDGAYGVLQSETPIFSPRIWTSIYTGKKPSVHGAEFFVPSSMVRQKRLWDIFSENGLKVGVFGSLVTWPPYPINCFMIPSIFATGTETYPDEYSVFQEVAHSERSSIHKGHKKGWGIKRLKDLFEKHAILKSIGVSSETFSAVFRYLISEKGLRLQVRDRYWRKAFIHLQMSADVFLHLYHRFQPDFATFHNHLCDAVSHRYWDCFEPQHFHNVSSKDGKKYGMVIPNAYIHTDKMLGRILSHLDPFTTVIVVSDHGMEALSDTFRPYNMKLDSFVRILGVQDWVIPARFGTKSFLYFADNRATYKKSLLDTLRSISFAETGEKLFEIETKDQYVILSPASQLWKKDDIPENTHIRIDGLGTYQFYELFNRQKLTAFGNHHKEGIFIFYGPKIIKGRRLKEASIYDIAPTILTIMGFPQAKDMEGTVLTEIIDKTAIRECPTKPIDSYEDVPLGLGGLGDIDIEMTKERLRLLGYL